jgi:magnesium-transporting ATPase (P-type)
MYDESSDEPAHASNTAIAEDLGQIEYIFTDKTGTLTDNKMIFKKCTIREKLYGDEANPAYQDARLLECLADNTPLSPDGSRSAFLFFRALSLCHTVTPEETVLNRNYREYRGSSPDEEELVKACSRVGIVFEKKENDTMIVNVQGTEERYEVVNMLEFTSERKRMSVLVRPISVSPNGVDGRGNSSGVWIFTKGADDVILSACRLQDDQVRKTTTIHIDQFAQVGYRTLCLAYRHLSDEEYTGTFPL